MYPIDTDDLNSRNADNEWTDFERTGSILSYLRYKGIGYRECDFSDEYDESSPSLEHFRDGEPIGYY
ncbi:MAG: hypothetical protein IJA16_02420 [Clostridia bacterium]|nr:hypothetical protein [Clostridia bacterium]